MVLEHTTIWHFTAKWSFSPALGSYGKLHKKYSTPFQNLEGGRRMANVFKSHGLLRNKMRVASLTSRQKSRKISPHPSPPQKSGRELFLTRVERKLTPPFHSGLLMSPKPVSLRCSYFTPGESWFWNTPQSGSTLQNGVFSPAIVIKISPHPSPPQKSGRELFLTCLVPSLDSSCL